MNRWEMLVELSEELSVKAGYAAWAPLYDSDGNPLAALEGPAMARWWGQAVTPGTRVLDLGCGTGRHTRPLVDAGALVTAVDQSPEMLAYARDRIGEQAHWLIHSLPDPLPCPPASFDVAVSGLVFEHLEFLDVILADLVRVLRPGGRLIFSALHPDRIAEGQTARFIDPLTGVRRPIKTVHRTIADYNTLARNAGLHPVGAETLVVPPALADDFPRAARYVGLPLGWISAWMR